MYLGAFRFEGIKICIVFNMEQRGKLSILFGQALACYVTSIDSGSEGQLTFESGDCNSQ